MPTYLLYAVLLVLLFWSSPVLTQDASCTAGSTCVPSNDLKDMVTALKGQKCLKTTQPTYQLDPGTVVTDKDGRVFVSGAEPRPYTLKMQWCSYTVTAQGKVSVLAATVPEPTWGGRLRIKGALGYLSVEAWEEKDAQGGIDIGVMVEPLFYHDLNLNGYIGVRSLGAGIGLDLTKNMTLYGGYALAWGTWRHNPHLAVAFALW